ncbi:MULTISPECIES: L-lactate MFS transporter [Phyllobacteriaceae]|uniref:OFA family MFS transporter n=1 Tax=Ollibium composti TaxID=2675109 RepID=A0ABY2QCM4_9HYPH|nr:MULTISPECIES: OFA family MFS transporter [Mesorhizobium]QDB99699.1 OFA family MFS transporter [Mesorhizobium sp. 8]THF59896.1 OFA family MFS transporter [Mesorhizobium composti]
MDTGSGGGGWFSRSRTVAKPGFSRWMVPPAALCVHLCIGQAYAFSVFNLPMTKLIGISESAPDDWKLTELGWIFSIAIFFLGVSSAVFGRWVEEGGPRKAMFTAACCWAGGFLISAFGVSIHNLWVIYLGYGVLGGIALGIGYISPVSTLIKWFPDRPGMATGMAIMGFGGGAFIASPLSVWLMGKFGSDTHVGVMETFVVLAIVYFIFMVVGSIIVRVPPADWKPEGYVAPRENKLISKNDVYVYDALKTPQFWLIWVVLCVNTTAGIGVLGQASAMSQEMFPGHITPIAAAGLVGLMSLFNMGGRFAWASTSDYIGRRNTYFVFMVLGFVLYCLVPLTGAAGSVAGFVLCFLVIISMYGGGFSTVPAYLRDMFGTRYVGAIHGLLLTAWSAAGIFGPVLVNYIRQYNVAHDVPKAQAYNTTMYIMAGLFVIGFICNFLVKAVDARFHMKADRTALDAAGEAARA